MSTTVAYKGNVIHTAEGSTSFTLNTQGNYLDGDVEVVVNESGGGGGGGDSNITVSIDEPTSSQGSNGDIWVQYFDSDRIPLAERIYKLTIIKALRGNSDLSYAGATELDIVFDDGNGNEVLFSSLGITKTASGGSISNAFDGNTNTYWESNPTPIWCEMKGTVPAGYVFKKLKVMQRTGSFATDVWKEFDLTETIGDMTRVVAEASDLGQSDWAGAPNYTYFNVLPDLEHYVGVVQTFVKINGEWVSPANIDVNIGGSSSVLSGTSQPLLIDGNIGDTYIQYKTLETAIISDGAKIDTGIDATSVYAVEFEFEPISLKSSYQDYLSSKQDDFSLGAYNSKNTAFLRHRGASKSNNISLISSKNILSVKNGVITFNNSEIGTYTSSQAVATNSANIFVFGASNDSRQCNARFYSLKLYGNDDSLLFNGVAKEINGTAGIYDSVSQTLKTPSSGTVVFETVSNDYEVDTVYKKTSSGWVLWTP